MVHVGDALMVPFRRHRSLNRLEVLGEQGEYPVPAVGSQQGQRGIRRRDLTQPSRLARPWMTHRRRAWEPTWTGGASVKNHGPEAGWMST